MTKKCTMCKWHNNPEGINCEPFDGNNNADVVFVGEAYGKSEMMERKPFVGKSGFKFNELLEYAGLKREEVAIINCMRCYLSGNPTPTSSEIASCFIYTYRDLKNIKPKLIVTMGNSALYSLTDKTGVSTYRGRLMYSDKVKCNIFPVYHPASCLYDPNKWAGLVEDFKKIPSLINEEPKKIKLVDYTLVDIKEKFRKMYRSLMKAECMSFDVETFGLNMYDDNIEFRCLQLGKNENEIYILPYKTVKEYKDILKILFKEVPVIGQTFDFDAKWLKVRFDIYPEKWLFDTCLAEYILTGTKENDLTFLTNKYNIEIAGYDDEVIAKRGAHKIYNLNELYQYGACDVSTLFPIMRKQKELLEQTNRLWIYKNITLPCNKVLTNMSLRGITYDLDLIKKVDKEYGDKAQKLLDKALKLPGIKETETHFGVNFNPRSSHHLKYLLLDFYKLPMLKTTKKGNPSIGKQEMKAYSRGKFKNKYCATMGEYRSIQQVRKNFLSGVIPKLTGNVAHTTYSLHSTNTSRPNSRDPNLLNVPRDKNIKQCIVAPSGFRYVAGDFSQLEVRISAIVYSDPALIALCNNPTKDFHSMIASKIYNMDYVEFYDKYKTGDEKITELRNRAKTISFATLYQISDQALAYRLGVKEYQARQFIEDYFRGFPDLYQNIENIKQEVIEKGELSNFFGFRRTWKKHTPEDASTLREAVNFPVQSLAFNLVQYAMIKLDNIFANSSEFSKEEGLCMQVYDSIVGVFKIENVQKGLNIMRENMVDVNKQFKGLEGVALPVDFEVGRDLKNLVSTEE